VSQAKGISVHIGVINVDTVHYQGWDGELISCEDDALDMQEIALGLGFKTTLLRTQEATRENVIRAIEQASRQLEKGDLFLLTYSGHGGQIPIQSDGPPANAYDVDLADRLDETWCLYDAQLLDDELNHLYRQFPTGVRILLIQDCCHSGFSDFDDSALVNLDAGDRPAPQQAPAVEPTEHHPEIESSAATARVDGAPPTPAEPPVAARAKAMPKAMIGATYEMNRDFYEHIRAGIPRPADGSDSHKTAPASILAISACREHELAVDGTFNGAFTGALKITWASGSFADYCSFYEHLTQVLGRDTSAKQTPEMYSCATDPLWISTVKTAKVVPWAKKPPFQI